MFVACLLLIALLAGCDAVNRQDRGYVCAVFWQKQGAQDWRATLLYEQPNPEKSGEKAVAQGGGSTPGAALNDAGHSAPVHPFYGTLKLACLPSDATQSELRQAAKVLLGEIQPTASVLALLLPEDGGAINADDAQEATTLYDEIFAYQKKQGLRFAAQRIAERKQDIFMPCYKSGKLAACYYSEQGQRWLSDDLQVQLAATLCGWCEHADFLCEKKGIRAVGRFSYAFCPSTEKAPGGSSTLQLQLKGVLYGESEREPRTEQTSLVARKIILAWDNLARSPFGEAIAHRMGAAAFTLCGQDDAKPAEQVQGQPMPTTGDNNSKPLRRIQTEVCVIEK